MAVSYTHLAFINDNELSGIYLEPDTKRYYPSGALASQVLGFVNTDNVGTEGIEARYDSYLEGTAGEIIKTKGNNGSEMLYQFEKYYEASDGDSVILTIDSTVQYYLEDVYKRQAGPCERGFAHSLGIAVQDRECSTGQCKNRPNPAHHHKNTPLYRNTSLWEKGQT